MQYYLRSLPQQCAQAASWMNLTELWNFDIAEKEENPQNEAVRKKNKKFIANPC